MLPDVRLDSVPRSWDPRETQEGAERRVDDETPDGWTDDEDEDEDEDDDDDVASLESVDVLMTGMEEPW
jgi:hypothetical protein